MADVLCMGEILVDWVCTTVGAELESAQIFTKAPGGAPANVAVGLARQGVSTAFIGRVSKDEFGNWLKNLLRNEGIDTTCTIEDEKANTRMAYVVTTSTGDRKLAEFSRVACADAQIHENDLHQPLFEEASILHFGSISLIQEPAASATRTALQFAHDAKLLVSYDPNVRLGLWPSAEVCKKTILDTLKLADIVKINLDELEFLTGSREFEAALRLREQHSLALVIITLDANGCYLATAAGTKTVPGFPIQLVEATGAGDGFVSGILSGLLPLIKGKPNPAKILVQLDLDVLGEIARKANAVGALACTRAGAIPALPTGEEVNRFLEQMTAQASS